MNIYYRNSNNYFRTCNHLYYALKYYASNDVYDPGEKFSDVFKELNINYNTVKAEKEINVNNQYISDFFYENVKSNNIEKFIKDTILKSALYDNIKSKFDIDIETTAMIHIRNGDYLTFYRYLYNRKQYFENCFSKLPKKVNTLIVLSDDNKLNKFLYNDFFRLFFDNVIFKEQSPLTEDLMFGSMFKYKILSNSTYSYWMGFIGDVIYESDHNVYVPNMHFNDIDKKYGKTIDNIIVTPLVNPDWNIVEVNTEQSDYSFLKNYSIDTLNYI